METDKEIFVWEEGRNTPRICFNSKEGTFYIRGKSFPENARKFYQPLVKWIAMAAFPHRARLELQFDYISSASVIAVLELLKQIEVRHSSVKVAWIYEAGDEDMQMVGQNYGKLCTLDFEFVEIP